MNRTEWKVIKAADDAGIPDPGFEIDENTAIVITDPQNDFLRSDGADWPVVKASQAALMNLRLITSHMFTTEEFEKALKSAGIK